MFAYISQPRLSIHVTKALISADSSQEPFSGDGVAKRQKSDKAQDQPSVPESETSIPPSTVTTNVESQRASDGKGDADTQGKVDQSPSIHQSASKQQERRSPPLPESQLLAGVAAQTFSVLPKFRTAVDEISSMTRASIKLLSSSNQVAGLGRQDMVELQVTGSWENAEAARLLLLVAIDTLKPNVTSDKLTVELKFQNMIGGRKRQDLQELMARTKTSIYLTSPLVQTANKSGVPVDSRYNEIYITGEAKQVAIAKDALVKAYRRAQTASLPCTRQVNIAARKLDWMLLNHRDKLRNIMTDNATFIAFPPLGGTHPIISVYGESSVNVERTIRTVIQLVSHCCKCTKKVFCDKTVGIVLWKLMWTCLLFLSSLCFSHAISTLDPSQCETLPYPFTFLIQCRLSPTFASLPQWSQAPRWSIETMDFSCSAARPRPGWQCSF